MKLQVKKIKSVILNNVFILFTIFFFVFLIVGLLPIEIKNKSLLFSGLFIDRDNHDGLKQHLLFMRDYVTQIKVWISSKELFRLYRFDLGLGSDFFISYGYYSLFDPLTIIAYLIPIKYIELSYYLLIMIRLYLSGIFIILLARKFKIRDTRALLVLSIFYVFNNTVTYSAFRHPMFINGPMLIPLIILGAEKVIRREKPYLLIFSACYALMAQFYFFVYLAFGFELYVLIRIIQEKDIKRFNIFIKVNLLFLLGSLLASFVLFPQFFAVIYGGRTQSKGFIWYSLKEYFLYGSSYLIPLTGDRYSSSVGNFFIFFLCLLYMTSNDRKKWYSYYFIILSVLFGISFFGYAINAFSYVNNRWTFLMIVPVSLMLGELLEGRIIVNYEGYNKSFRIFLIFLVSVICFGLLYAFKLTIKTLFIQVIIQIAVIVLTIGTINIIRKKEFQFLKALQNKLSVNTISKWVLISTLISLVSVSIYYCFYLTPAYSFNRYYSDENTYQIINDDQDFFRVEQNQFEAGNNCYSNDNIFYKFNSTSQYNTMTNGHINNFITSLNVVNTNNSVGYNGFNGRARLLALNNVKYYIIRESEKTQVPYGFELYDTVMVKKYDPLKKPTHYKTNIMYSSGQVVMEKANIYINNHFVNFGNMYYQYVNEDDFRKLSPLEKENLLLDTLVLSNNINLPLAETNPYMLNSKTINNFMANNIEIIGNKIIVGKNGGHLKFSIDNISNSEVFAELIGIKSVEKFKEFTVTYYTDDAKVVEVNYEYGRNMYYDNSHHLVNLGYYNEKANLEINIEFEHGQYYFDKFNYYLFDASDIDDKVENLNQHSLTDLQINNNGFSGKIETPKDGLLYLSVPYNDGFSAYVNGQKAKVYKANLGYMAIEVPKGNNQIDFVYQTLGMRFGLLISVISICIIAIFIIFDIMKFVKKNRA